MRGENGIDESNDPLGLDIDEKDYYIQAFLVFLLVCDDFIV